jgi:hypothetical protein
MTMMTTSSKALINSRGFKNFELSVLFSEALWVVMKAPAINQNILKISGAYSRRPIV